MTSADIAAHLGMQSKDVRIGLQALVQDGQIAGRRIRIPRADPPFDYVALRLLAPGRRNSGQWPSDNPREALLEALERLMAAVPDEAERKQLEGLRDVVRDLSVSTLGSLVVAVGQIAARGGT